MERLAERSSGLYVNGLYVPQAIASKCTKKDGLAVGTERGELPRNVLAQGRRRGKQRALVGGMNDLNDLQMRHSMVTIFFLEFKEMDRRRVYYVCDWAITRLNKYAFAVRREGQP